MLSVAQRPMSFPLVTVPPVFREATNSGPRPSGNASEVKAFQFSPGAAPAAALPSRAVRLRPLVSLVVHTPSLVNPVMPVPVIVPLKATLLSLALTGSRNAANTPLGTPVLSPFFTMRASE